MFIHHRDSHLKDGDCLTIYLKNGRYIIYIALYYYRLYFKEALKFTVSSLLQRVLENTSDPPLPASMVKPHHGDLYWYLDQGAATLLANKEKIMNCWTSMQQLVVSELFHWQFLTCSSVEIIRFHIKFCWDTCKIVQQYYLYLDDIKILFSPKLNCACKIVSEMAFWGPWYQHGLTLIPAWISNHKPSKVWGEITYPFPNFNGCTI